MAKKKNRRRRPANRPTGPGPADQTQEQPGRGLSETQAARRERKEEARQNRQAALRRYRRERVVRRGAVWGAAAVAVVVAVVLIGRGGSSGSGSLPKTAANTATAAGCTGLEKPADQGRSHSTTLSDSYYTQQPPTSGPHDPNPLAAGVYTSAQPEPNLVHSLEHGAVEFYYSDSLPSDVVAALKNVATGNGRVIMTPAPETLSAPLSGTPFTVALAYAAWDRLIQCPSTITAAQATTLARAWIKGFVDASTAPERGSAL